jgi:gamma-glutamyl:cysteine ligase YbdK (ATP-grasp superfamily)
MSNQVECMENMPVPGGDLFSAFGVELEYMIVDAATLDVRPIADKLLEAAAGELRGDVDRGAITWSNELVAHVVEFKVSEPATRFDDLPQAFQENVRDANMLLAPLGARLMPGGMHPWMDPYRHAKLWPHDCNEVYEAFNRIFDCRGHGWSNLQSVHLNLPFAGDEEFGRLHAAVRLVLPILPALTASSPVVDGRIAAELDHRLEVYRGNSRKVPSIAGRVIPEPVFTRADYERQILQRLYADISPRDPAGTLQHEWLNARGAIPRFTRNTIEIRVMDVQECPEADIAICAAVVALLRALVSGRFSGLEQQKSATVDVLGPIFLATIRDGERAMISDRAFLEQFGHPDSTCTAGELWGRLIDSFLRDGLLDHRWKEPLDVILRAGPLARRITTALRAAGLTPADPVPLHAIYRLLCDCLERGEIFRA